MDSSSQSTSPAGSNPGRSFGGVVQRCTTAFLPIVGCPKCKAQFVLGGRHDCDEALERAQTLAGLMMGEGPPVPATRQPAKPTTPDLKVWRTTLRIYRGDHAKAAAALGVDPETLKRMVPRV